MNAHRLVRAGLAIAGVMAVALSLHMQHRERDRDARASLGRELRTLEALDARVDHEVLRCRSGLALHYDTLTRSVAALDETAALATELAGSAALALHLPELAPALAEKRLALERFKTENAILRNSRQYYPELLQQLDAELSGQALLAAPGALGAADLAREAEALRRPLGALATALAYFDVLPVRDAAARLGVALDAVRSRAAGLERTRTAIRDVAASAELASLSESVDVVLRHGRLIADHAPLVDELVARLPELPLGNAIRRAVAAHDAAQAAAQRGDAARFALLAAAYAAVVVLALLEVILQLTASRRALQAARDALERANGELERDRERERQQSALKTRFVAATSHEFRTPLTTIISSSQLLSTYGERWDAERRRTHFERIGTAARHMAQMIEELLLIGRAEMGALTVAPARIDVHEYCQNLADGLARSAAADPPGTPREVRFTHRGERSAEVDQRLLTHVLGNLLENALKYSPADTPVLFDVAVAGGALECRVEDFGIGIEPDDLAQVFDTFHRGKNVGNVAGTGLGLAAAKRALAVQGGTIDVQSTPGKGTRVTVRVPVSLDGAAAATESAEAPRGPRSDSPAALGTTLRMPKLAGDRRT